MTRRADNFLDALRPALLPGFPPVLRQVGREALVEHFHVTRRITEMLQWKNYTLVGKTKTILGLKVYFGHFSTLEGNSHFEQHDFVID